MDLAQLHIKTLQHNNEGLVGKGARWTAEVKIQGDEEQRCVCAFVCEVKRRREGVVPLIFNVGTTRRWSASHPGHLTPGQRALPNNEKSGCYWLLRNCWTLQKWQCRTLHKGSRLHFSPNNIMVIKSRRGDIQNELWIVTHIKLKSEIVKTNSHLGNVRTHRCINWISTIRGC